MKNDRSNLFFTVISIIAAAAMVAVQILLALPHIAWTLFKFALYVAFICVVVSFVVLLIKLIV